MDMEIKKQEKIKSLLDNHSPYHIISQVAENNKTQTYFVFW